MAVRGGDENAYQLALMVEQLAPGAVFVPGGDFTGASLIAIAKALSGVAPPAGGDANTAALNIIAANTSAANFGKVLAASGSAGDGYRMLHGSGPAPTPTPTPVPGAPTLGVTPGNAQNVVSWTDGTGTTTTRRLYRSTTSGFTPAAPNLYQTNPTFPFTDTLVSNGTAYYYKGIAANAGGDSPASAEVSGTPSGGGYAFQNAEASTLVARYTVQPDDTRKGAIDTLVGALKTGGVWAKLDMLQIYAAHDEQAATLNWKGTSATASVQQGRPQWFADRGYFVDGTDDIVTSGFTPSTDGVNYTLNSASIGTWSRKGGTSSGGIVGSSGTSAMRIVTRSSGDAVLANVNAASNVVTSPATVTNGYGLTVADRISASQIKLWKNGALIHTGGAASVSVPTVPFVFGRVNAIAQQDQIAASFAGSTLTDAEHLALYNALAAFMTAVGVTDPAVTASIPATATRAQTAAVTLPDGGTGAIAGKGWTCTGLVRLSDGTYLVGNDGRGNVGDSNNASIIHLSADGATILHQWSVVSIGLTALQGSIQGVAYEGDASGNGTIWFVLKPSGAGYIVKLPITAFTAGTPVTFNMGDAECNGVAIDTTRNQVLVCYNSANATIKAYPKAGFGAVSGNGPAAVKTIPLQYGTDNDLLVYVQAEDAVYVTVGANNSNGRAYRIKLDGSGPYGLPLNDSETTLTGADCIEGLAFNGTTMMIANDAWFHAGTPALNRLLTYAAP